MKPLSIFDHNMTLLRKVLDLRATNEKTIASNIANSETPGYSPARFDFEEELKNAVQKGSFSIQTTHQSHIPLSPSAIENVNGTITRVADSSGIGDQNGVSLDQEMMALSENELLYETATQLLKKKLSIMKYIIQGGQ